MRKPESNKTSYFTRLMITEVSHEMDARGHYKGSFTAIAEGTGYLPKPEFAMPAAEPQTATVISNKDPLGQGRVQVRFHWQLHDTTHFIRVMSPDAGGTDAVTQNRGFVAIPEIGDQVMVGFEYHNSSMPFVMGGMFHGGTALGGFADNHLKSIQTKSGIKVLMNDNERSATIQDPSGNTYFMDGQGNINVTAPNKITMRATDIHLNATDIQMNAYNNLEMDVSNNVIVNAMSKFFVFTPYMKNVVSGFMSFFSGKALFNSGSTLDIEAKEAKLHGTDKTIIHSDKQAIINSKGTAEMYGESGNQLSNKAADMTTTQAETISTAIVCFRPALAWNGEYGFDWLREDDNGLAPADDPAYADIIEGGYKDGITDLTGGATGTAYAKLKTQYKNIPISRKPLPPGSAAPATPPSTEYFVPYLTLFSQDFVNKMPATVVNKPKYEAELKVLVEIQDDIDRLEFEYDKTLFTIDKPILSDKTKTTGLMNGSDGTIKLTCLKDLDADKKINIYAYPKKEPLKGKEVENPALARFPDLKQFINRKLAGKIIVLKNDATARKSQKFVLVDVSTDVNDDKAAERGQFQSNEIVNLYNALHQSLILPVIEKSSLDLSVNADFQSKMVSGVVTDGKHVQSGTIALLDKTNPSSISSSLYNDTKNLFLNYKDSAGNLINSKYNGYFTLFKFGLESNFSGTLGAVQDIGIHNVHFT